MQALVPFHAPLLIALVVNWLGGIPEKSKPFICPSDGWEYICAVFQGRKERAQCAKCTGRMKEHTTDR